MREPKKTITGPQITEIRVPHKTGRNESMKNVYMKRAEVFFWGESCQMSLFSKREKPGFPTDGYLHWGCDIREAQAFLCLSPHQTRPDCAKHLGKLWRDHSTGLIPGFWVQILKRYECLMGFGDHQGNFSLDATPLEAELMSTCSCWFLTLGDVARWECRAHCPTLARSWSWGRNTWCASLLTGRVCVFKKATATLWVPATHECLVRISVRPLSSHTYDGDRHVGEIIIESLVFGDEISTQAALLFGLVAVAKQIWLLHWFTDGSAVVAVDMVSWKVPSNIFCSTLTLLGTNISPNKVLLKRIFLSQRWDTLVPWGGTCLQVCDHDSLICWVY